MTKIRNILTHLMIHSGKMSEYELARLTGISQSTINRIILGETKIPSISSLKKLASFFNLSAQQLLGNEPLPKVLPFNPDNSPCIADTMRNLMKSHNVTETDLAKQTGVAQSTINRILNNQTGHPRGTSLRVIAKFFNVTVAQLLGFEPLVTINKVDPKKCYDFGHGAYIPLIDFEQLVAFDEIMNDKEYLKKRPQIFLQSHQTQHCFATQVQDNSMLNEFKKGDILILDNSSAPEDGDYVIIKVGNKKVIFAELSILGDKYFIIRKNINPQTMELSSAFETIGVVIETRKSFKK